MRIDASATAITWLLFERSTSSTSFRSSSPSRTTTSLHRRSSRTSTSSGGGMRPSRGNEVCAWSEIDRREIVDYGQTGRSLVGDGPELEAQQAFLAAVEFPGRVRRRSAAAPCFGC